MSIIIYQDHCEFLEKENERLREENLFLKTLLEYKTLGLPLTDQSKEGIIEP